MKFYVKGARLAWAESLFVAKAKADDPNSQPKFQGTFIVESGTTAFAGDANPDTPAGRQKGYAYGPFKEALSGVINKVATEKFGGDAPALLAQLKAQNRLILHDGVEKGARPGYAGNSYFNAGNKIRPMLLAANGEPLVQNNGVLYPGCYVFGVFDVWAGKNAKGQNQVGIALLGVQFIRDGERLSGGVTAAADDFEAIPQAQAANAAASGGGAASLF